MQDAIANLERNIATGETEHIIRLLDVIHERSKTADEKTRQRVRMDGYFKVLLRRCPCIEVIEKIGDMLGLVDDPRSFYDELIATLDNRALLLPSLMLIFHISDSFDFTYDGFYARLEETVTQDNVCSEGYLLFMLRCLQRPKIELPVLARFVRRLSRLSALIPSEACVRVVYCILVVMRLHPPAFQLAKELGELTVHARGAGAIRGVVQRIYAEARRPSMRPKSVFLQNFAFPALFPEELEDARD